MPYLETAVVWQEETEEITIFAVNRDLEETMVLETELNSLTNYQLIEHLVLEHHDLKAANSKDHPDNILPHPGGQTKILENKVTSVLNKLSWNVICLKKAL